MGSLVVQQVKAVALSLLRCGSLLWRSFSPWLFSSQPLEGTGSWADRSAGVSLCHSAPVAPSLKPLHSRPALLSTPAPFLAQLLTWALANLLPTPIQPSHTHPAHLLLPYTMNLSLHHPSIHPSIIHPPAQLTQPLAHPSIPASSPSLSLIQQIPRYQLPSKHNDEPQGLDD